MTFNIGLANLVTTDVAVLKIEKYCGLLWLVFGIILLAFCKMWAVALYIFSWLKAEQAKVMDGDVNDAKAWA